MEEGHFGRWVTDISSGVVNSVALTKIRFSKGAIVKLSLAKGRHKSQLPPSFCKVTVHYH